jgi:hypothetical protein
MIITKHQPLSVSEMLGTVLSLAILLGFAESKKNGWHVGWVEARNPTKDIGMLNPTYE